MKNPKPTTVPVPAKLRRLIEAHGLRGRVTLTRPDGSPASADEARELADVVAALDVLDRRTAKALEAVAKVLPAARMGAVPTAPAKPAKALSKRRAR